MQLSDWLKLDPVIKFGMWKTAMKSLWILYLGIIPLCIVECEYAPYYLDEHCGRTLHVENYIRLQASRDKYLRPDLTCVVRLLATPGDSARIHTRFLSINLSLRTQKCDRTRIELYEGTGNANLLTPINGLCGDFLNKTYSYITVNESIMIFNLTTGPSSKEGSFDAIVTNFHKVEEDEKCLHKWWKCRNDRCVAPSTRCNTFDNCGDSSDETHETCNTTLYFYENCGQEIHVYDSVYLKLKPNDGYLIPDILCDNIVVAHGKFPDLGEVVSVYAHFRSISLSQPEDGVCKSARIDIYSGLKDKKNLTGSEGVCGNTLAIADYSTTDDNFMPIEFKTDIITQRGNFEIILTSFHTPSSGDCLAGEFRCDNGWCVDSTVKCDGFQNCRDKSDEKDELCKPIEDGRPSIITLTIVLGVLAGISFIVNVIACYKCIKWKCQKRKNSENENLLPNSGFSSGRRAQVITNNSASHYV